MNFVLHLAATTMEQTLTENSKPPMLRSSEELKGE